MNNSPQISFVVPCYNYARYLPDCLNSILGQEGNFDFEIIVIDDASTDNTVEVVRSFTDPRIRYLANAVNLGHAKTINKGLAEARGKFIARIDPDDRYRTNYLSLVMPKFAQFPEVGMVYGDACVINSDGDITIQRCDQIHGGKDVKGNELIALLEKNFICAPTVMARAAVWLSAMPAPEWLAFNDWYFTLKMARECDFYYIDQVLADYRVHSHNHHHKVVVNKSEEPSIFWMLDHVFNTPEKSPSLESQKQQAKRRIYGAQYLDVATKYFGCQYNADSRRCFWRAMQHRPAYVMRPQILRQFLGTLIGRRFYESIKMHIKTMLTPIICNRL